MDQSQNLWGDKNWINLKTCGKQKNSGTKVLQMGFKDKSGNLKLNAV